MRVHWGCSPKVEEVLIEVDFRRLVFLDHCTIYDPHKCASNEASSHPSTIHREFSYLITVELYNYSIEFL